jgi:hypothetical protein
MGAQGTPVAQATTQLGALIRELSSDDSKEGDREIYFNRLLERL